MRIDGVLLLLLFVFIMIFHVVMQWKKKADKWDVHIGNRHDEYYVKNYQEIMNTRKFEQYKIRMDYLFISLASFYDWAIRRFMQIRVFAKKDI